MYRYLYLLVVVVWQSLHDQNQGKLFTIFEEKKRLVGGLAGG
jgi:hypothetical protein